MVQKLKSKLWTSRNFMNINLELELASYLVNYTKMTAVSRRRGIGLYIYKLYCDKRENFASR